MRKWSPVTILVRVGTIRLSLGHLQCFTVATTRSYPIVKLGNGRPDVRIIPVNQKIDTCVIFEFNEMRKSAKDGLNQIVDKNYRSNTASHIQMIVEVAIAFYKKSTFVSARLLQREKV